MSRTRKVTLIPFPMVTRSSDPPLKCAYCGKLIGENWLAGMVYTCSRECQMAYETKRQVAGTRCTYCHGRGFTDLNPLDKGGRELTSEERREIKEFSCTATNRCGTCNGEGVIFE